MGEIKLSFVVPFYNVEKYIYECLDSIYSQNVPEYKYEVICIDDFSPDNSKSIVKEFQKMHTNLILIEHDHNKGLGGARNSGINSAKGDYVWFVDSDDMINPKDISLLYELLDTEMIDVILFNYERVNQKGEMLDSDLLFLDSKVLSGREYVDVFFGESFVHHLGFVWRCVFRTDYLLQNNICFPSNCYWEDTVFFPKSILEAKKIKSLKNIYYQYRFNENSISGVLNKYKADRVFQFAFIAGKNLYDFSQSYIAIDIIMAGLIREKSIWYYNSFRKPLLISNLREKRKFFNLIKENKSYLKEAISAMSPLNRFICKNPNVGLVIVVIISPLYLLKNVVINNKI